jgi:hypothetical protein
MQQAQMTLRDLLMWLGHGWQPTIAIMFFGIRIFKRLKRIEVHLKVNGWGIKYDKDRRKAK